MTLDDVVWSDLPDREEAGSPNVVGAVALAAAARRLWTVGMARIARHETDLTRHLLARLAGVPGLTVYGPAVSDRCTDRVGVVPFTLDGVDHGLVAAVLGYEHGIGLRSGCFCAHAYLAHLLELDRDATGRWLAQARRGETVGAPGMVRISLGCYSDRGDIDRTVEALHALVAGDVRGVYDRDDHGGYAPRGYREPAPFELDRLGPARPAPR